MEMSLLNIADWIWKGSCDTSRKDVGPLR